MPPHSLLEQRIGPVGYVTACEEPHATRPRGQASLHDSFSPPRHQTVHRTAQSMAITATVGVLALRWITFRGLEQPSDVTLFHETECGKRTMRSAQQHLFPELAFPHQESPHFG